MLVSPMTHSDAAKAAYRDAEGNNSAARQAGG